MGKKEILKDWYCDRCGAKINKDSFWINEVEALCNNCGPAKDLKLKRVRDNSQRSLLSTVGGVFIQP